MTFFKDYKKNEHNDSYYKAQFNLTNLPTYIANSIRRSFSSINPIVTFDDNYEEEESNRSINIKKNTSALHDQFLSHRLSLIPINMELKDYINIKTLFNKETGVREFNFADENRLIFTINIINNQYSSESRDKDGLISITSKDFIITSENGSEIDSSLIFLKDIFTNDHILIDKLKFNINDPEAGEELNIECFPTIGTGKINARYDPTGTVTFQNKIDESRLESTFNDKVRYLNRERQTKGLDELNTQEIAGLQKSFNLLDKERVYTVDSYGNSNNYELSVESIGFMSPDSIIYNSLCSLILLIKDISNSINISINNSCLDFTTNSKITISELDHTNVNSGVNINIKNENHTIGNMLSMLMRDLYTSGGSKLELDVLKYVGYKMQHPAIEEIDIIIIPNENDTNQIIKYIIKLISGSIHDINISSQIEELKKKDKIYLNNLLSILLFIKTINICNSILDQIRNEFIEASGFSTTYENAGYLIEDSEEYFTKNTDIIGELTDVQKSYDFSKISKPFNVISEQ